jgi:hypothetical protein
MDVDKIIRERKEQARRMRRQVAEWVLEGMSKREAQREYDRIAKYEYRTEAAEELLVEEKGFIVNKIGFV